MAAMMGACERVLLVEDEPDTLDSLASVLLLEGASVVQKARTVAEAERILASGFRPSAVVLDLVLEHERGEVLLDRMRANPMTAAIPVVVLTGDSSAFARLPLTPDRTLLKPAEPRDLVKVLAAICRPGLRRHG